MKKLIEFIIKAKLVHGDKYDYSKFIYINTKTNGIIICKKHGEFLQTPNNHLRGTNCLKCYNDKRSEINRLRRLNDKNRFSLNAPQYLLDEFDHERNLKEFDLTINDLTINSHNKDWWKCLKYNHSWQATIYSRSKGNNCPHCCIWDNQEKVRGVFGNLFRVKFEKKRFYYKKTRLEFDGYNSDLKIAFEYNGKQHYEQNTHFQKTEQQFLDQQKRDLLKVDYCKKNKIKLIIIPYTIKEKNFKSYIRKICRELKITVLQFDF